MEELRQFHSDLIKALANLRKSPNRAYSEERLTSIRDEAEAARVGSRRCYESLDLLSQLGAADLLRNCELATKEISDFVNKRARHSESVDIELVTTLPDTVLLPSTPVHSVEDMAAAIPFKDVQKSFVPFDGVSGAVERWIADFESAAVVYGWGEIHMFVYCKQLLTGAAEAAVRRRSSVSSFATLKAYLLTEFKSEVNTAEVHAALAAMRKKKSQTALVFAYEVQSAADLGGVDERATLTYLVQGLGVHQQQKAWLLSATTWAELKPMLVAIDKAAVAPEPERPVVHSGYVKKESHGGFAPAKTTVKHEPRAGPLKCYNCAEEGHMARDCKKPVVCHKCKQTGHRSSACPKQQA